MSKEISSPDFFVSARFADGRVDSGRILLKQRGEYVPYARERTCQMDVFCMHDEGDFTFRCSECGKGYAEYEPPNYCPNCGAKVVERGGARPHGGRCNPQAGEGGVRMIDLKPCPFCGGKASVIDHHNDDGSVSVGCADDTCLGFSGLGWLYKTESEAVKAWNNRYERTCTMEKKQTGCFTGLVCSKCGSTTFYRYTEPDEDGIVIGCPVPHYCPNCGAKVMSEEEQGHAIADAIRRLEKAVEE